jgi:hypothetical protein
VLLGIISSLGSDDTKAPTPATKAPAAPKSAASAPATKALDEPTARPRGTEVRDGRFAFRSHVSNAACPRSVVSLAKRRKGLSPS